MHRAIFHWRNTRKIRAKLKELNEHRAINSKWHLVTSRGYKTIGVCETKEFTIAETLRAYYYFMWGSEPDGTLNQHDYDEFYNALKPQSV